MSSRERWTVYPLIFLSLGIALRSKVTGSLDQEVLTCRHLTCHDLTVVNEAGQPLVRLGEGTSKTGWLGLYNAKQKEIVVITGGPRGVDGEVLTFGQSDKPVVRLFAENGAGAVETYLPNGLPQVSLQSSRVGGIVRVIGSRGMNVLTPPLPGPQRQAPPKQVPPPAKEAPIDEDKAAPADAKPIEPNEEPIKPASQSNDAPKSPEN